MLDAPCAYSAIWLAVLMFMNEKGGTLSAEHWISWLLWLSRNYPLYVGFGVSILLECVELNWIDITPIFRQFFNMLL